MRAVKESSKERSKLKKLKAVKQTKQVKKAELPLEDGRRSHRKEVTPIQVDYLNSLESFNRIAKNCLIVQASSTGLLLQIKRESLIPMSLRRTLTLDNLIGTPVHMHLGDMNLELSGTVARTQLGGSKDFLVAIDYTEDAPEYWRDCLMELLPNPGEFE